MIVHTLKMCSDQAGSEQSLVLFLFASAFTNWVANSLVWIGCLDKSQCLSLSAGNIDPIWPWSELSLRLLEKYKNMKT